MSTTRDFYQNESIYATVNRCRPAQDSDLNRSDTDRRALNVHRNWFEVKDKLLDRFPILTEEDVQFEPGKKHEMMRALEEKLEMSPGKLQRIIAYL
jgi:hypothetical protein